jgi:hypothetical protein
MKLALLFLTAAILSAQQKPAASPAASNLLQVKRIYVAELTGGPSADSLRELIIAGIDAQKLFVLTDNPDRADAILKGAADEHAFENTFDSNEGLSTRQNGGKSNAGTSALSRSGSIYAGLSASDSESHHIKERKQESYAAVRLCNLDGDVLWSTTQESLGAKFRGAGADVASKIARQLAMDVERERRAADSRVSLKP